MQQYLLAIDQGTTNSRAIIFNQTGRLINQHEIALTQFFPHDGWVEQDPSEMFNNTVECCRQVLLKSQLSAQSIAAIGISNQRETTIIWDKLSGKPIYPAIVWQDRRTSALCKTLSQTKIGNLVYQKTGLLLDPYFSATKIMWVLDHVKDARKRAMHGEFLFGTVDTYLLWQLTKGQAHATDITNASRTMLFNIHTQQWDQEILQELNIPTNILPQVFDNTANFCELDPTILGEKIPITGMAGDQQAATIGQTCFQPGMVKTTYGTGCFMLLNTGNKIIQSQNRLLSTIAYRVHQQTIYGLEGSIFSAGSTIKWLRDSLKIIQTAAETEALATSVADTGGVYLVPAFTGLGAPYWEPTVRGAILGLTRNTGREHIVRAALESVAYQSKDLLEAMTADCHFNLNVLRVDGGMAANTWFLQFLSEILNIEVHRPACIETTALGVAYLAGLQIGIYRSLDEIASLSKIDKRFTPTQTLNTTSLYEGWIKAVRKIISMT